MRLLIVISGFYPAKNYGGPVVSIENFTNLLGKDCECYIVTRDCEFGTNEKIKGIKKGWNIFFNAKVLYVDKKRFNSLLFNNITKKIKPDLIYLNSFFSYNILLPFIKISKRCDIPILLAPRGELCKNAFNMKKNKKFIYSKILKMILKNKRIFYQSTSVEETNAIKRILGVKDSKIFALPNVPTVYSADIDKKRKRSGSLNAIFVSRIHPKKNLLFVIECLKEVSGNVNFDIFGPKEDAEYWNKIKKIIASLPDNIRVRYCGNLDHEEIIPVMSKYECLLFYTLSENYGHVIAEAVNALCVPVISDMTPWSDIEDFGAGFVSELENKGKCIDNIQKLIDMDNRQYSLCIKNLIKYKHNKINIGSIRDKYLDCINRILNGNM